MALSDGGWTLLASDDIGPPYGNQKYTEYEESGDFTVSADNASVTKIYQVDHAYRLNFANYLYGFSTYANEAGGNYAINRILPEQHDEWINYYCRDMNGKTYAPTGTTVVGGVTLGTWKMSRVTAVFAPRNFAVLADGAIGSITYTNPVDGNSYTSPNELNRYCTRAYHYVLQQLTTQGLMQFISRWKVVDGVNKQVNPALDTAPGQMIVYLEKEITWYQVPARQVGYNMFEPPNRTTVERLGGCINSTTFDGHNPGTVVFVGYQPTLRMPNLSTGLYTWDITYRFLVQDHGQQTITDYQGNNYTGYVGPDWIYDTLYNRWDLISSDGTVNGYPLYPTKDLNALFALQSNS